MYLLVTNVAIKIPNFLLDLHTNCQRDMYRCKDGSCIYDYEVCDGHSDCKGDEDEHNCSKYLN